MAVNVLGVAKSCGANGVPLPGSAEMHRKCAANTCFLSDRGEDVSRRYTIKTLVLEFWTMYA